MRLTQKNLPYYLVDRGFIDPEDLINGHYMSTQTQSRNAHFNVRRGERKGLFVKQLIKMDRDNTYLMQKDATVHYLIHNLEALKPLRKYVPEYFGYDLSMQVLALEYFSETKSLLEWCSEQQNLAAAQAIEAARLFAQQHINLADEIKGNNALQFFDRSLPWVLKVNEMNYSGGEKVLDMLMHDAQMSSYISDAKALWSGDCLVHGDIKLVNFLVDSHSGENLKLIDWEIANIGDPFWDVGGFVQGYLFAYASNLQPGPQGLQPLPNRDFWNAAERKQVLFDFWKTYMEETGLASDKQQEALIKTMKYTAARLMQSAREMNQYSPMQLSPQAQLMINMAIAIFQSPEEQAKEIFGKQIIS